MLWLLSCLVATTSVFGATPCMYYCSSGDTLSGTTCTDTYSPTLTCRSGFSVSGGYCYRDACIGTNAEIGSKYEPSCTKEESGRTDTDLNTGCTNSMTTCTACKCCYCYTGSRAPPSDTDPEQAWHCLIPGPGGIFTITPSGSHWCYTGASPRSTVTCPSGSQYVGSNQCRDDVVRTCPAGGSLNANNMCVRTYAASVVTTSAQCSVNPSTAALCDWCTGIRICMLNNKCVPTCYDVSDQATCNRQGSACHWCTDIGVCLPDTISGCPYGTCLGATANPTACGASADCKWCAAGASIGVCQPTTGTCYATCLAASAQSDVCDTSTACKWCAAGASIGVCQPNAGTCYATCLAVSAQSDVCDTSTACKWCAAGASIGVCQPTAGTCYATCLDASITAEAPVCAGSQLCSWCAAPLSLPYCRRNTEACQTVCTDVARYDPAICQVPSMASTCTWCAALRYCVSTADAPQLRCASRCEAMIWRRDVCGGALACHWCPQHGGRCKPVVGETQGYVNWRGESECDTGSGTASSTVAMSHSMSTTCAKTMSATASAPLTTTITVPSSTDEMTLTASVVNVSFSSSAMQSISSTVTSSLSSNLSMSHSLSLTRSATPSCRTGSSEVSSTITSHATPSRASISPTVSNSRTASATPSVWCYLRECALINSATGPERFSAFAGAGRHLLIDPWPRLNASAVVNKSDVLLLTAAPVSYRQAVSGIPLVVTVQCGVFPLPLQFRSAALTTADGSVSPLAVNSTRQADGENAVFSLGSGAASWLSPAAFAYRDSNAIRLSLVMTCEDDNNVTIVVPVSREVVPSLLDMSALASASLQWVAGLGVASVGGSLGRAAVARRLMMCSTAGASSGGLLGLSIPHDDDDDDGTIAFARGAVMGNAAVVIVGFAVLLLLAALYSLRTLTGFSHSLLRFSLPSSLLPLWLAAVPSTSGAVPLLLQPGVRDAPFAVVGGLSLLLPLLALAVVYRLVCVPCDLFVEQRTPKAASTSSRPRWLLLLRRSLERLWIWRPRGGGLAPLQARRAWVVLLDHRTPWYASVDAASTAIVCALSSVSGMGSTLLWCSGVAWLVFAIVAVHLGVCVALRPMTSVATNTYCIACLLLTAASVLLQAATMSTQPSQVVMTVVLVLELIVVGMSAAKVCYELQGSLRKALLRIWHEVADRQRSRSSGSSGDGATDHLETLPVTSYEMPYALAALLSEEFADMDIVELKRILCDPEDAYQEEPLVTAELRHSAASPCVDIGCGGGPMVEPTEQPVYCVPLRSADGDDGSVFDAAGQDALTMLYEELQFLNSAAIIVARTEQ